MKLKKKFIETLESYLNPLEEQERKEIIAFYEERFYTGTMYEGKTEQEIVDELENPKDIARNVLREYGYKPRATVEKPTEDTKGTQFNFFQMFWLILFNIFVVTWLVPVLISVIISVGGSLIGFIASINYPTTIGLDAFLFVGFIVGVIFLWLLLTAWLYDVLIAFIIWLVRWHMNVFLIDKKKVVLRFMRRFKISYQLKKRPVLYQWKQNIKGLSAILVIAAGLALLIRGQHQIMAANQEMASYHETHVTEANQAWHLDVDIFDSEINVIRTDESEITVSGEVIEDYDTTIRFDETSNTIFIENERTSRFVITFFWDALLSKDNVLYIYIPNDIDLKTIDVESTNGDINIDDFDSLTYVDIVTTNGRVVLSSLEVETTLYAKTTNGRILASDIKANDLALHSTNGTIQSEDAISVDLEASSSNGNVILSNSTHTTADVRTTNGRITLENINDASSGGHTLYARTTNGRIEFEDVYFKEVEMRSTNGNLDYVNSDRSFRLDQITYQTTNGSTNIDVPRN